MSRDRIISCALAALLLAALPAFAQTGHQGVSMGTKLAAWAGRLHPLAVHFPIALLIAAAVLQWFPAYRRAARLMASIGAASAVVAAGLGWLDAAHIRIRPDQIGHVFWHRWIGTAVAVLSVGCTIVSRSERPVAQQINQWGLMACAALIAIGGHLGGELVYGEGYFQW